MELGLAHELNTLFSVARRLGWYGVLVPEKGLSKALPCQRKNRKLYHTMPPVTSNTAPVPALTRNTTPVTPITRNTTPVPPLTKSRTPMPPATRSATSVHLNRSREVPRNLSIKVHHEDAGFTLFFLKCASSKHRNGLSEFILRNLIELDNILFSFQISWCLSRCSSFLLPKKVYIPGDRKPIRTHKKQP